MFRRRQMRTLVLFLTICFWATNSSSEDFSYLDRHIQHFSNNPREIKKLKGDAKKYVQKKVRTLRAQQGRYGNYQHHPRCGGWRGFAYTGGPTYPRYNPTPPKKTYPRYYPKPPTQYPKYKPDYPKYIPKYTPGDG